MKNTMKRTLGFFAAALLTMTLALSAYASGHDLTRFRFTRFSDGSRIRPGPGM